MDFAARMEEGFWRLLEEEKLTDFDLLNSVEVFDEVPIYSRLSRLSFLDDLELVDRNRFLIRATTEVLHAIQDRRSEMPGEEDFLRLVSVTGWWIDDDEGGGHCMDGSSELLVPHLWIGNMSHPDMEGFRVSRPSSRCASFVGESVLRSDYVVAESDLLRSEFGCPTRVYIGRSSDLAGSFAAYVDSAADPMPENI